MPIIAMTAHAMKGDKERCLEAGMDGYVSKPVRSEDLYQEIDRVLGRPAKAGAVKEVPGAGAIDRRALLRRFAGDEVLLDEVVGVFLAERLQAMRAVREALDRGDGRALERSAHTLKGSIGNFTAGAAFEAALRLETLGRAGDLPGAEAAWPALQDEIERLSKALAALRKVDAA